MSFARIVKSWKQIYNSAFSNEIEVAPLINLDNLAPSYDEIEEDLEKLDFPEQIINEKKIKINKKNQASIGILNKITAKVSNIKIYSGEEKKIFDLKILNKACHISLPEEDPLIAVYLVVDDLKSENSFSGWMIKDLPSLSIMEHSLYDVWVNDCF